MVLIGAFSNTTGHLNHIFTTKLIGSLMQFSIVRIKNDLSDAITVTHINKRHAAHFTATLHPTGQSNLAAGVAKTEFSACICSKHTFIYECFNLNFDFTECKNSVFFALGDNKRPSLCTLKQKKGCKMGLKTLNLQEK